MTEETYQQIIRGLLILLDNATINCKPMACQQVAHLIAAAEAATREPPAAEPPAGVPSGDGEPD